MKFRLKKRGMVRRGSSRATVDALPAQLGQHEQGEHAEADDAQNQYSARGTIFGKLNRRMPRGVQVIQCVLQCRIDELNGQNQAAVHQQQGPPKRGRLAPQQNQHDPQRNDDLLPEAGFTSPRAQ